MNATASLDTRFVRVTATQPITLHQPGRTRRAPHKVITGRLLGGMHMRGVLHHYRVAGDDGVLYLAPPSWVAPECRVAITDACVTARMANPAPGSERETIMGLIADIGRLLDERDAGRAYQVVPVGWMHLPDNHPLFNAVRPPENAS